MEAQTPINHSIFWKSGIRTFRCIYVNCFNRFRFFAAVSTNFKKCTFLDNLQTISHEGNMETKLTTPFFSSTFSALFVTFTFLFENKQNSLWCGPPFGPFWSVKYLNFGQKLPLRTTHHTFLESRQPEVTKNPYYVLTPSGATKVKVPLHELMPFTIILIPKTAKNSWQTLDYERNSYHNQSQK